MKKIFVDKNYDIIQKNSADGDEYLDVFDEKIDLVIDAITKGTISKEEGVEILKIFISKEFKKEARRLVSNNFNRQKNKSPFVFLLEHSSLTKKYVS